MIAFISIFLINFLINNCVIIVYSWKTDSAISAVIYLDIVAIMNEERENENEEVATNDGQVIV